MSLMMITATLREDAVDTVDAAIESLFAAVAAAEPEGVRYASTRLPDGVTSVILLQVDEGVENPLASIPEFVQFQQDLRGWITGPQRRLRSTSRAPTTCSESCR